MLESFDFRLPQGTTTINYYHDVGLHLRKTGRYTPLSLQSAPNFAEKCGVEQESEYIDSDAGFGEQLP